MGSADSYVQTSGTGCLTQPMAASDIKTFPVGRIAYNPAALNLAAGSTTDDFCIRVEDDVFQTGSSGATVTDKVVDRTWFVNEGTAGGSTATLTVTWNSGEALGSFDASACYISHYTGSGWNGYTPGMRA
ncbi:MAG: hypothetical protein IPJ40_20605 [Saprospirales bacterium]|nr:hypothetical protein [Saprospirales bacterium]